MGPRFLFLLKVREAYTEVHLAAPPENWADNEERINQEKINGSKNSTIVSKMITIDSFLQISMTPLSLHLRNFTEHCQLIYLDFVCISTSKTFFNENIDIHPKNYSYA